MAEPSAPIIIKRISHGGHGHHGGAWKVAFADFVTAMMAFFLLMWLINSTTKEERAAISQYFDNPSAVSGAGVTAPPTPTQGPGGASTSMIDLGGALEPPRPQTQPAPDAEKVKLKEIEAAKEKKRLDDLMVQIKEAIENNDTLKKFKDQLHLDITPEGLRIQIVDKENRPMFSSGSSYLKKYSAQVLKELATFIDQVPNKISISGHTDATPMAFQDYSNWELSADRANSARRALVKSGLATAKVAKVVGLASSVLFDKENPINPVNRRISIIVLNKRAEEAIQREESMEVMPTQDIEIKG